MQRHCCGGPQGARPDPQFGRPLRGNRIFHGLKRNGFRSGLKFHYGRRVLKSELPCQPALLCPAVFDAPFRRSFSGFSIEEAVVPQEVFSGFDPERPDLRRPAQKLRTGAGRGDLVEDQCNATLPAERQRKRQGRPVRIQRHRLPEGRILPGTRLALDIYGNRSVGRGILRADFRGNPILSGRKPFRQHRPVIEGVFRGRRQGPERLLRAGGRKHGKQKNQREKNGDKGKRCHGKTPVSKISTG